MYLCSSVSISISGRKSMTLTASTSSFVNGDRCPRRKMSLKLNSPVFGSRVTSDTCVENRFQSSAISSEIISSRRSVAPKTCANFATSLHGFSGMMASLSPGPNVMPVFLKSIVTCPVERSGSLSMESRRAILALNRHSSKQPLISWGFNDIELRNGPSRSIIDSERVRWTSSQGRPSVSWPPALPLVSVLPVFATTSRNP